MEFQALVQELIYAYHNAPEGKRVTMVQLFGVKYADIIIENHCSIKELLEAAEIPLSYYPEIKKGMKLSEYVYIRPEYL